MDKLDSILNFRAISPLLGTAGQPTVKQFTAIRDAGYVLVINLALSTSDGAIANEAEIVRNHGMEYIQIPVVWERPELKDLEEFFEVMDHHQGRKVFVHCVKNMRVSVFICLYRVFRQGISPQVGWEKVLEIWEPNPIWQAFIENAQKALSKPRIP